MGTTFLGISYNHSIATELMSYNIDLQNKLNNPQFIAKAPKNIIEQFKMQSKEIKSSIEKIDQIINTIN